MFIGKWNCNFIFYFFIFIFFIFSYLQYFFFFDILDWSTQFFQFLFCSMLPAGISPVLCNVHVILSWKTKCWAQATQGSHWAAQLCLLAHLFSNRSKATVFLAPAVILTFLSLCLCFLQQEVNNDLVCVSIYSVFLFFFCRCGGGGGAAF